MNNDRLPLVSCLCVTRNKPEHLKRAVKCFESQTYPNKELVIVFEDDDAPTKCMLQTIENDSITVIEVPGTPKLTLGKLRNLSIEKSSGEYFCQWDDDDWYHNDRLKLQMDFILNTHKPACILAYWLMFDSVTRRAFLSRMGLWSGSILCKKSLIMEDVRYPDLAIHEDAYLMRKLVGNNCVFPLLMPSLYIYSYHGNNTFNKDHFNTLYASGQLLSAPIADLFANIFEGRVHNNVASKMLFSSQLLKEINYFHYAAINETGAIVPHASPIHG